MLQHFSQQPDNNWLPWEQDTLMQLAKALAPGYGTDSAAFTGADALRPESLDNSLHLLTYQEKHIQLWRDLAKMPAYSTIEEYNVLTEYGSAFGGFMDDGDLPAAQDSTYERRYAPMIFMGHRREVTYGAKYIRTQPADLVAQETLNGIRWMLQKIEWSLFFGNNEAIPQMFDGFFRLIENNTPATAEANIIDKRGEPLTQEDVQELSRIIADNYGMATDMYASYRTLADLSKQMYPKQRVEAVMQGGTVGAAVTQFLSQSGPINLKGTKFLAASVAPPSVATNSLAPATPSVGSPTSPVESASLFVTADAGDYYYRVTAVNKYGESAPVNVGAVTVSAGDKVTFVITDGGGGNPATGYMIYRTEKDAAVGTAKWIKLIKKSGATTTFNDLNADLPGTSNALMLQNNADSLCFKVLHPMVRVPLAVTHAAERWMQLFAGGTIMFAPQFNGIIKNIGPLPADFTVAT